MRCAELGERAVANGQHFNCLNPEDMLLQNLLLVEMSPASSSQRSGGHIYLWFILINRRDRLTFAGMFNMFTIIFLFCKYVFLRNARHDADIYRKRRRPTAEPTKRIMK